MRQANEAAIRRRQRADETLDRVLEEAELAGLLGTPIGYDITGMAPDKAARFTLALADINRSKD